MRAELRENCRNAGGILVDAQALESAGASLPPPVQPVADGDAVLNRAISDLHQRFPQFSAATLKMPGWTGFGVLVGLAGLVALSLAPGPWLAVALSLISVPFFFVVQIRLAALWMWARDGLKVPVARAPAAADADLPAYSLLVPLYREATAAPGLVAALSRLDYPAHRLEILFITEADDEATRAVLTASQMTPVMRILTVPDGLPRTKPRALNYALQFTSGDLIAIYDAEDQPAPDQLRAAAAAFAAAGPKLACVQAPLVIYNAGKTVLTRQFALEYAALFDAVLPALQRLGLPLPLGGTSNHFRRDVLEACGAWDPYNVTEDADLGFRLARFGYDVAIITPPTAEEAPPEFGDWLNQRTRWLKGWMQTYFVHMRAPRQLWRDLGAWRFLGFQAVLAGMILSALVHPWFYGLVAWDWGVNGHSPLAALSEPLDAPRLLWVFCVLNLGLSYACSMALATLARARRGEKTSFSTLAFLPVYWLFISAAAYRAIGELIVRPYYWAKTEHRGVPVSELAQDASSADACGSKQIGSEGKTKPFIAC